MASASRSSWATKPLPARTDALGYSGVFTEAQAARLRLGFVPRTMDDRWFIFFEENWLYFFQSRTGACIYALRLDRTANGVIVGRSWVNRMPGESTQRSPELDRGIVDGLIKHLLL